MRRLPSLSVSAIAIAFAGVATAQTPDNCVETLFASNNGGAVGWTMVFDVEATESVTVSGLRTNVEEAIGTIVQIEVWTAATSVGNELDPTAWISAGTAIGTSTGSDSPTEFLFPTPIDLAVGSTGMAIVHTTCAPDYTNATGSNEVHSSADGVLTVTTNAAVTGEFAGAIFGDRVWNGNFCYDLGSAEKVTTLFDTNNGGATDGAVYFNVQAASPTTIGSIQVNSDAGAGTPVGVDIYTTSNSAFGNETNAAAWRLVATDDGSAVSAAEDTPTTITLAETFQLPPGTTGIAIVADGFGHAYTNGSGANLTHISADRNLRIIAGSGSNVPFAGQIFNPRVFNGQLCAVTADNCVETSFDSNNGGAAGGAVYFDVVAAMPVTVSGLNTNGSEAGAIVGMEMWVRNGTFAGNESDPSGWTLVATGDGTSVCAEDNDKTPIRFVSPVNLPAGRTGVALLFLGAGHDYTNGTGANQIATSQDNILRIEAGSASNTPFSGTAFSPRVWNGSLCYDAPFIGNEFCEAVPNSTGETGTITALGSNSIAANNVRLVARNLPNGQSGIFVVSQTFGISPMPGGSLGTLCIAGPSVGRYQAPGQIVNSGGNGSYSLLIDLTAIPTPSGSTVALPGQTWNYQSWHRDVVGGAAVSNFTNAISIQFTP